jgi:hypothetical protein
MKVAAALVGRISRSAPDLLVRLRVGCRGEAGVDAGRRPGGLPHLRVLLFNVTFERAVLRVVTSRCDSAS